MLFHRQLQCTRTIITLVLASTTILCNNTPPPSILFDANTNRYQCDDPSDEFPPYDLDDCWRLVEMIILHNPGPICTLTKRRGDHPNELECPYTPFYGTCGLILDFPGSADETRLERIAYLALVTRELVARCEGRPGGTVVLHVEHREMQEVTYVTILSLDLVGNGSGVLSNAMVSEVLAAKSNSSLGNEIGILANPVVE